MSMQTQLRPAISLFVVLSVVTGVLYPLAVTGVAQGLFPHQANGSIVTIDGKPVGSELIGQQFSEPKYFWGRLSATGPYPYNAGASSGSNLGPLNPALTDAIKGRIDALKAADPGNDQPVPVDLVTASASGLDPDISLAAAYYQMNRVANARNLPVEQLRSLIDQLAKGSVLGIFGEPRVNVLRINLALDGVQ
jgi:K+-transporting ATPase ATPase C chain